MKNWGIHTHVTMLAVGPAVLLACVLAFYFTFSRIGDAEDGLRRLGLATAQHLAVSAEYGVVTGNNELLQSLVNGTVRDPLIRYALVSNSAMSPLAAAGGTLESGATDDYFYRAPIHVHKVGVQDFFRGKSGEKDGVDKPIGWVTIAMSREALNQSRIRMFSTALIIVIAGIFVTGLLAASWGESISRPVRDLSRAVLEMERGRLSTRVEPLTGGELGKLQAGFNRMAASLEVHQDELKRRILEATAVLEVKKEEAERANQAKSSFLAAVSHDLRQPMHAVGLFAAALRDRVNTEEQAELVQRIEDSVSALQIMFDDLLNFSRLDAGVVEASMQPCDLKPILNRVWQDFQPVAAEKGLNLRVRIRSAYGLSDPVLLSRLLANLVANAVRYTEHGGILVGCRRRGQKWVIEVRDSGIGIPAEHLPHVFEEYYQVGNEERNRTRGVGLGLAIVHKIAQVLGHEFAVRSWVGKGSIFSVTLDAAEGQLTERRLGGQREIGQFTGERVLVIDDDKDARDSMSQLLQAWGLNVTAVESEAAAMAYMDQAGLPCLIVCDFRLPGTTGIELIHRLRGAVGKNLPALIVTGDTSAQSISTLQASGMSVLHKPVRPAKLRALISSILNGREAGSV